MVREGCSVYFVGLVHVRTQRQKIFLEFGNYYKVEAVDVTQPPLRI